MKKKTVSRIFYLISIISLIIGAAFHGYRTHPENAKRYRIGVTMGIVMISVCAISLIVGILLTILDKNKR